MESACVGEHGDHVDAEVGGGVGGESFDAAGELDADAAGSVGFGPVVESCGEEDQALVEAADWALFDLPDIFPGFVGVEELSGVPFGGALGKRQAMFGGDVALLLKLFGAVGDLLDTSQVGWPFSSGVGQGRGLTPLAALSETGGVTANDPSVSSVNAYRIVQSALRENFDDLRALLDAIGDGDLTRRLTPEDWNVREILLHVVHTERWLQPQLMELRRVVAPALALPMVGGVTLPDSESEASLAELRWALTSVREDTERLLSDLTPSQLREPGNLEIDGETLDLSLRSMALTAADHQLTHVRQIQRTLGRSP